MLFIITNIYKFTKCVINNTKKGNGVRDISLTNPPVFNSSSINVLIDRLKEATGLKFRQYQRKFLEKRISFRTKYLNLNINEYIEYIQKNPIEVDLFLDKFTINYTYFFRNLQVFENFEKFIKLYVKKNTKKDLKIWSAPCATGDESYTLAMILDNLKKNDKNFPKFQIVASDIDKNALRIAEEGIYGEYAIHEMPSYYLKTYFSEKITDLGPKYTIKDEIKRKVEFVQEDIIHDHKRNNIYDVIFCRNFFIYINQIARNDLLRNLDKRIYDGGLLVLGGSENIPRGNSIFNTLSIRDHFYIKNLMSKSESYRNIFETLFMRNRRKKTTKTEYPSKMIQIINEIKKKPPYLNKIIKIPKLKPKKESLEKEKKKEQLVKPPLFEPTEVRFTGLIINNGVNNEVPKEKPSVQLSSISQENLRQREEILEQKEKIIVEKFKELEEKYKILEKDREELTKLFMEINEKEKEITSRLLILERIKRQIEQRERTLNLREEQLEKRLTQMKQYSKKMMRQEIQLNNTSIKSSNTNLDGMEDSNIIYEEQRMDRIKDIGNKKELKIKMGYYGLIHSFDKNTTATKFQIEGLGSGAGLILRDPKNHVFAMSHISLPNSSASKQGYHLLFPHTFADTSVKDLFNNLLYNGASRENIKALIVGGAKLFLDYDMTYQENIDTVKKKLQEIEIEIEAEDIGGLSERSVIYDTINDSLFVKKTWEFEYRKIF
ncbi:MAG: CheR family methyltransferase [Candidatus Thorarchaeota archaeon]